MNDVKLNDLHLVQPTRSAPSSPSPELRSAASAADSVKTASPQASSAAASSAAAPNVTTSQPTSDKGQGSQQELHNAVARLNDYVQNVQRDIQFQVDEKSGKTVITVVDRQTKEVVRQIPNEVALRLAHNLQQDEPLSLFHMKV